MVRAAVIGLALALAGCKQANDDICSPVMSRIQVITPITGDDIRANVRACVEHWAARLSLSNEPVAVVVKATMGACHDGIVDGERGLQVAQSFEWKQTLESLATFRAVQQRAGNCGVPDLAMPD